LRRSGRPDRARTERLRGAGEALPRLRLRPRHDALRRAVAGACRTHRQALACRDIQPLLALGRTGVRHRGSRGGSGMSANRKVLDRYVERYNAGDLDRCVELYAEDAVQLMPDGFYEGRSAIRERLARELEAFPDIDWTVESFLEDG